MNKGRILIVEDERIVAMDIRETLENYGFSIVDCVTTGEEAVKVATREQPDLVLMDIRLAGKIDGLEAARRIQQHSWIPTVFLTAFGEQDLVEQAKDVDAFGYILKPFDEKDLGVNIDMILNRVQSERKLRQALISEPRMDNSVNSDVPYYFRTFGGLQLQMRDQIVLRSDQFSKTQRTLLGLLLTAPLNRLPLQEVQSALWPDSPAEKARSSFDSLMLRTRRVFAEALPEGATDNLIVVKRGILMLTECQIDMVSFKTLWQEGLAHCKQKSFADAERSFLAAIEVAKGQFLPSLTNLEPVVRQREELERALNDCHLHLGKIYSERRDVDAAIRVVEKVAASDPLNDSAMGLLVRLYQESGGDSKLKSALNGYRAALRGEGHRKAEIERIVVALCEGSPEVK